MPRYRSFSPISAASEKLDEEGYAHVDAGDMYGRKWDPNNEQHKYVAPTTYQSVAMTVNHAWNNPSLQTTRNSIADIANDLRPVLSEKIDRAGAKMRNAATKLSAGVAKATKDFASSKDRRSSINETRSEHSQVHTDGEPGWQPIPHALSASSALATSNMHTAKHAKPRGTSGGSLMALEAPPSKEADRMQAPKYRSKFADRAANKENRTSKEADDGRKRREQRKSRRKEYDSENPSLSGQIE